MGVPQVVMIVLLSVSVYENLVNHGKDKGKYNFWGSLIGVFGEVLILKSGGFF